MPHPAVSTPRQSDFLAVPESPLVYWLSQRFFELLMGKKLEDVASVKQGMATADDNRFVRFHWEITSIVWVPFSKGGGYGKWFGHQFWVVNWGNNGANIKATTGAYVRNEGYYFREGWTYSYMARGSIGVRAISSDTIISDLSSGVFPHKESVGLVSSINNRLSSFIVRSISAKIQLRESYVARIPIPELVPSMLLNLEKHCLTLKRYLVAADLIERSFRAIIADQPQADAVAALLHALEGINEREVFAAYGVAGDDMRAVLDETGTPAGFHPLIAGYDALPELPAELALHVVTPSGGGGSTPPEGVTTDGVGLPQEVLDYLAQHQRVAPAPAELARIKARLRGLYEAGPGAREDEEPAESAEAGDDGEEEGAVSGAHIPIPTETFLEELSVRMELHPISVYWLLEELRAEGARCKPEEQRLLEDRLSVLVLRLLGHRWPRQIEAGEGVPGWADPDGIIPISPGVGEATLAERVRARLRAEDGDLGAQRAEALLSELTRQTLEEWLRRTFFKRHVRQFKYRPVAWHLASDPAAAVATADARTRKRLGGRRQPAFECMVYYHACGGDVLARIRTQYVDPLLRGARQQLEQARQAGDEPGEIQATMRIGELEEFSRRLQQVAERGFASPELDRLLADEPLDRWSGDGYLAPATRDELLRQERAWRVDLNDGVRVNIAPVQLAGLLASDVLKAADAKKASADRARWRSDERRWVRAGKLPRCGWLPEAVPESPEWTRLAPQRAAEQARLEEKRRAALEQTGGGT